jgi:hypothetical protein
MQRVLATLGRRRERSPHDSAVTVEPVGCRRVTARRGFGPASCECLLDFASEGGVHTR